MREIQTEQSAHAAVVELSSHTYGNHKCTRHPEFTGVCATVRLKSEASPTYIISQARMCVCVYIWKRVDGARALNYLWLRGANYYAIVEYHIAGAPLLLMLLMLLHKVIMR